MANIVGKIGWKITTIAVGIPVGIAVKKTIDKAWAAARPGNPSRETMDPEVGWGDALGWAVLSGIGVAVTQLVTTKGAASLWRRLIGAEPPVKKKEPEPREETERSAT